MSNAYRRFQLNHGFFSLLGANMTSCWHPKSMKKQKKRRCQRVSKKDSIFKSIFIRFWRSLGSHLGSKLAPRTAQDGAQERPRDARDGPRDAPESLLNRTVHPRRGEHPKMTPRTPKMTPFLKDLGGHFSPVFKDFEIEFYRIHGRTDTNFPTLRSPPLCLLGLD